MTDHADRDWRLIREEARPGPLQMALDEVAAETAASGGPRTVRVYRWAPSCLSMGYGQAVETVDWEHCESAGVDGSEAPVRQPEPPEGGSGDVDVTRRQTGGGGIYHDNEGDIAYSIAAPAAELPGELIESYHELCPPILDAFARLGVDADFVDEERPPIYQPACYLRGLHPAHDVVSGGAGRKLAGNAQYRRKDAVIQHGSITYDARPEAHLGVFSDPRVSVEGFEERVAGITDVVDVSREEAVDAFETALQEWAEADEGSWTDDELARAEEIADAKYRSDAWIRERDAER